MSTKSIPTEQRIFAYYQSVRNFNRQPRNGKHMSGSRFNNTVALVALHMGVTMSTVREAIINQYAKKHGITVEESRTRFEALKENRVNTHQNNGCEYAEGIPAWTCGTNYPKG